MKTLLWCVYLILGLIVALPYTYFASGDAEDCLLTTLLAPVAIFSLIVVWHMGDSRYQHREPLRKKARIVFWVVTAYWMLPIICNGSSHLLNALGFTAIAYRLFEARYLSLALAPFPIFVLVLMMSYNASHSNKSSAPAGQ